MKYRLYIIVALLFYVLPGIALVALPKKSVCFIREANQKWLSAVIASGASYDDLLKLAHFFAPSEITDEQRMICIDSIKDPIVIELFAQYVKDLEQCIMQYYVSIEKKFKNCKVQPKEKELENLLKLIEEKLNNSVIYFHQYYYKTLYNYLVEQDSNRVLLIFNHDGNEIIEPNYRYQSLPVPDPAIE